MIRKANEMTTGTVQKPPTQADSKMAKQIIAIFPWVGQLWASAVRDGGGGSPGRYKVLNILAAKGPIRAGELATLCASSPSGMSESIESLSAEGFVRRVDDPTDRRAVVVALTEQGSVELERVRDLMTGVLTKQLDALTADQRSRLRSAVNDLTEILIDPAAKKENPSVR
jgi:DNA-binding MarR family transcriptional regulator